MSLRLWSQFDSQQQAMCLRVVEIIDFKGNRSLNFGIMKRRESENATRAQRRKLLAESTHNHRNVQQEQRKIVDEYLKVREQESRRLAKMKDKKKA